MKRLSVFIMAMTGLLATAGVARGESWGATLTGYEESPPVSTVASGDFRAIVQDGGRADHFHYSLTYSGLQGTVTQAHIHVGQLGVNGSIIIWLCGTASNPGPSGTQTCPPSGTITGRITAADVIAGSTASQQLNAMDFDGALAAIRAGVAYANVHTSPLSGGGEIRGQIRVVGKGS